MKQIRFAVTDDKEEEMSAVLDRMIQQDVKERNNQCETSVCVCEMRMKSISVLSNKPTEGLSPTELTQFIRQVHEKQVRPTNTGQTIFFSL